MRKKYVLGFILLLSVIMGGCRFLENSDFRVNYTGIVDGEFTGHGDLIPCYKFSDGSVRTKITLLEVSDREGGSSISLSLPLRIELGRYTMSDTDFSQNGLRIMATIFDTKRNDYFFFHYDELVSGYVEFTAIPSKPLQHIQGNFEGQFQSGPNTLITRGQFDFIPSGDFPDDCLESSKTTTLQ